MLLLILFGLVLTAAADPESIESRVVRTAQGAVRGYKDPKDNFFAFYGIPYATAPTGPHKFKGPLPPPTWTDTLEATNNNIVCPQPKDFIQIETLHGTSVMKEDCLIINVFIPDTEANNLPVVVYVHGGAFQIGFGSMFEHRLLLKNNIIVVNFNYRLAGHGFLCLGTEDVPGNAGMKDQVAALRWVKQNIANFGGNSDDVSVAGYSAGATAVSLLSLSKSTRGLFNKVIPESGAAVGVWSVQIDPLATAKTYARLQNFEDVDDVYALEDFYKNLPMDVLQADSNAKARDSVFYFVPCVEPKGTKDAFLTDAPVDIIKKGEYEKLPLLTGFADMEGIFRLNLYDEYKDDMNKKFSDFLPGDLRFDNEHDREKVARKIKELYFGEEPVTALGYVNYFSDVLFIYPTHRFMALAAEAGSDSLYWYIYAFEEADRIPKYPGVTGANHCAQSAALGDMNFEVLPEDRNDSKEYRELQKLLINVWTNFIITGKPAPKGTLAEKVLGGEWPPTSPASPYYVLFNTTSELRGALLPERMRLWDEIYSKYYRIPIPPPKPPKKVKSEL